MVAITRKQLKRWQDRINIVLSTGSVQLDFENGRFDRFISTYVVDLLSDEEAINLIEEAHRVLRQDGLLCLVSITPGVTLFSRMVMGTWRFINKLNPILTGGCRPVRLPEFISEKKWNIEHHQVITRYGVVIEVVIASRR